MCGVVVMQKLKDKPTLWVVGGGRSANMARAVAGSWLGPPA